MPTYQYACTECGHDFEQVQKFSDDALTECPQCSGKLRKVYNAVGVVFKGSGFYRNDSRPSDTSSDSSGSSSDSTSDSKSDKKSDSTSSDTTSTSSEAKPAKTDAKPAAPKSPAPSTSGATGS